MTQIEYLAIRSVIFKITVPNSSDVYMSAESSSDYEFDADRFIVIVNAKKILQLWQNTGTDSNCGGIALKPNEWSNDYKYHWATDGFAQGKKNPVPLAEVVASTNLKHSIHVKKYFNSMEHVYETAEMLPKILLNKNITICSNPIDMVSFQNGITRTLWLLNNGAEDFPVHCYSSSLSVLLKARQENTRIYSYAELFH